jgi:hypothetical protein
MNASIFAFDVVVTVTVQTPDGAVGKLASCGGSVAVGCTATRTA